MLRGNLEVQQKSNYGTYVVFQLQPTLDDPNDPRFDEIYIAASKDANGELVENPHLGFGSGLPFPVLGPPLLHRQ